MASFREMYEVQLLSIPQIAEATSTPRSTVRCRLLRLGVTLRTASKSISLRRDVLGKHRLGKRFVFSDEHKRNISVARSKSPHTRGWRISTNGYREYTNGPHKGRTEHVILMEGVLGRRVKKGESVHHVNGNKLDNRIENLLLTTRSEHAKIHQLGVKNGII